VHTGPAGEFALDEIAAVEGTRLRVTRSGLEPLETELPADDRDDMTIALTPVPTTDRVHGRVLGDDGLPVAGARVALGSAEVRSDEQGYFRLGLPEEPGPWTIRAVSPGRQSDSAVGKRNGDTVGAIRVTDDDEIMLISSSGTLVRTGVSDISVMGRNTQGVRLIRVGSGQRLVGLARIEAIEDDDE